MSLLTHPTLSPVLSIADRLYAQLKIGDLGRAEKQWSFPALVPACRHCGLLQHSLAAYERAVRLDPNIRTSVHHTFFMLGDDLRADAVDRGFYPHETFTRHAWLDPLRNCRCKEAVYEGAFGTPETVRGYGLCRY